MPEAVGISASLQRTTWRAALAPIAVHQGRTEEAGELYRTALDIRTEVLGDGHPEASLGLMRQEAGNVAPSM